MEKQMDEIELKRIELTQKHNQEIEYIKTGIKMLLIDEIIPSIREAILEEIRYSFQEKWKLYRKEMEKLDKEMPKKYY
jgi:flagellar motor component MotA